MVPAAPLVNDGSFDTNLRSALQALQVDSVAPQFGTSSEVAGSSAATGPASLGPAKSEPQRVRRADAAADRSASGQLNVIVPLMPPQDGALSWQIPTGANLALQAPAVSNGAPAGGVSALHTFVGEADFLRFETGAPPAQQSGQDAGVPTESPAPETTTSADAAADAAVDFPEAVPTKPFKMARAGLQTESLAAPGLASVGGRLQATDKGAAQVQMPALLQPSKGHTLSKEAGSLGNDSFVAGKVIATPAPTVAASPASSGILTPQLGVANLLNTATQKAGGVTSRNLSRFMQTAPGEEPSSPASAQAQGPDMDPALFSVVVDGDQGGVSMTTSPASASLPGSKVNGGKTDAKSPLLDSLLPLSGGAGTADRGPGQPQAPVPVGGTHQASPTGAQQAGEVQPQGAEAANLQRVLQRSEVQVHIDAAEYGRVSVHASYGREGLAARIRLEDTALGSALGSALSAGAPTLEQRLRGDLGTRALVSVSTETGSARSDAGGGQGESRAREQARVPPTSRNPSTHFALTTTPVPTIVRGIASGTRLDVHI